MAEIDFVEMLAVARDCSRGMGRLMSSVRIA